MCELFSTFHLLDIILEQKKIIELKQMEVEFKERVNNELMQQKLEILL